MAGKTLNERTKKLIKDAFEECLIETGKPIEKLTVTEICERAGINRKTFYYHFDDMESLTLYALQESGRDFGSHTDFVDHPEESISYFISFVFDHKVLYREIIHHYGLDIFKQIGFADETIFAMPQSVLKLTSTMSKHAEEDFLLFYCQWFSEALCDVLYHAIIVGDAKWTKEQITDYAIRIWNASAMPILGNHGE